MNYRKGKSLTDGKNGLGARLLGIWMYVQYITLKKYGAVDKYTVIH